MEITANIQILVKGWYF